MKDNIMNSFHFLILGVALLTLNSACGKKDKSNSGDQVSVALEDIDEVKGLWLSSDDFSHDGVMNLDADEINLFLSTRDFSSLWYSMHTELIDHAIAAVPSDCSIRDDITAAAKITGESGKVVIVTEFPTTECVSESMTLQANYMYYKVITCDGHDFASGYTMEINSSLPSFDSCTDGSIVFNAEVKISEVSKSQNRVIYSNVKELKTSFTDADGKPCTFTATNGEVTFTRKCLLRKYSNDLYNYSAISVQESDGIQLIPVGKAVTEISFDELTAQTSSYSAYYPSGSATIYINNWTGELNYSGEGSFHPFDFSVTNGSETLTGSVDCFKFPACD